MNNIVHIPESEHSFLGASSANRWLNCPGSIPLAERLRSEGKKIGSTSSAAAEGTVAHTVLANCLEEGSDANEFKDVSFNTAGYTFVVDDEMVESVQQTLDFVRGKIQRYKKQGHEVSVYIEENLNSYTDEEAYGTSDITIHVHNERIVVIDFKYGRGVTCEPTSEQNRYYCYLAIENYLFSDDEIKVVESWIAQPRIPHAEGIFRRFITGPKELVPWWNDIVLVGIEKTRNDKADLVIGDHCIFCPAKSHCPALKGEAFNYTTDIDPSHLSGDELGELLLKGKTIIKYIEGMKTEAFKRCMSGQKVTGYKLVNKKANRTWKEGAELEAIEIFGKEAYKPEVLNSPAQIDKLTNGKKFTKQYAFKPNSGLTIAPNTDRRSAVRPLMDIDAELNEQ